MDTQLCKRLGPSVGLSVGPFVRYSIHMQELKCGNLGDLMYVSVGQGRAWSLDGIWTPLPTRSQRYCDPESLVYLVSPYLSSFIPRANAASSKVTCLKLGCLLSASSHVMLLLLLTGGRYPCLIIMNRHLIFREAIRSTTLGHAAGSFLCHTPVIVMSLYCLLQP